MNNDNRDFELPSPTEKLASKFILDAIHEKRREQAHEELDEPENLELTLEAEPEPIEEPQSTTTFALPEIAADKRYFRAKEVSELLNVEAHVIRYWENEFSDVRPHKTASGHRIYSRKDVQTLCAIKHLLHQEKFSIKGAKQKLADMKRHKKATTAPQTTSPEFLRLLHKELRELVHLAKASTGIE